MKDWTIEEFTEWALQFVIITGDMVKEFLGPACLNMVGMTLEQAKMKFSHIHQQAFTDSWAIRRAKDFPIPKNRKLKRFGSEYGCGALPSCSYGWRGVEGNEGLGIGTGKYGLAFYPPKGSGVGVFQDKSCRWSYRQNVFGGGEVSYFGYYSNGSGWGSGAEIVIGEGGYGKPNPFGGGEGEIDEIKHWNRV